MNDYLTMKELGRLFGVSSHVVGKKLKEAGLRTADGRPTKAAFNGGFCSQRWAPYMAGYCWAWANETTLRALEDAGLSSDS
jgi:hypothetical protein